MIDYSIGPSFLIVATLLLLVATPAGRLASQPPHRTPQRLTTLDGLRGFLALSVALHHALIYRRWVQDGVWAAPPSLFYARLGPIGVSLFFMITGYLFWSRLQPPLEGPSRRGLPFWRNLYIGRIFRIGPVFVFAVVCASAGLLIHDGFQYAETTPQLLGQIGTMLLLGLGGLPFHNLEPYIGFLFAGVTWTLQYEWCFYLSLPFTSIMARIAPVAFPALLLVICLVLLNGTPFNGTLIPTILVNLLGKVALFLVGMLAASLHQMRLRASMPPTPGGIVVVGALAGSIWLTPDYSVGFILLIAVVFYLVASGCSIWGLLLSRGAQRLGNISYPIYLLQGLALALSMVPRPLRRLTVDSPLGGWATTAFALLLLVVSAMVVHVTIERPGIALGRSLIGKWARCRARAPAFR